MSERIFEHLKDSEGRDIFIGNVIEVPMWDSDDSCNWAFRYKVLSQDDLRFLGSEFQNFNYQSDASRMEKVQKLLSDMQDHPNYPDVPVKVLCPFDCKECESIPDACGKCHECGRQWAAVALTTQTPEKKI